MDWAAAPFPAASPELGEVTFVDSDILVIPRGARNPEGAWAFIRFVQQQENIELLAREQRKFSPLREVSDDFYVGHPNPHIELYRRLAESPNARSFPMVAIVEELREEMNLAVEKVWLGVETPEIALQQAEAKLQRLLDRSMRQWERIRENREQMAAEEIQKDTLGVRE